MEGQRKPVHTYSSLGFCTVNCRPTASNYQLSYLRPCREPNPSLRGGRRVLYQQIISLQKSTASAYNFPPKILQHQQIISRQIFPAKNLAASADNFPPKILQDQQIISHQIFPATILTASADNFPAKFFFFK